MEFCEYNEEEEKALELGKLLRDCALLREMAQDTFFAVEEQKEDLGQAESLLQKTSQDVAEAGEELKVAAKTQNK